jgi:hypothetical protein
MDRYDEHPAANGTPPPMGRIVVGESSGAGSAGEAALQWVEPPQSLPETAYEVDPYAEIRSALRPDHAVFGADEITATFGRRPALVTLHRMLASPGPLQASLAVLLGRAGRVSLRLNGSDVALPSYLRVLSRLCREAAEQSEEDLGYAPAGRAEAGQPGPIQEWDTPPPTPPPVVDPFPAITADPLPLDTANATLNSLMAAVAGDKALSSLCGALVDLTDNPATPAYAGLNDGDMVFVGSLQKISAMYAAFELRSRVRAQTAAAIAAGLSTASTGWEKPVITALDTAWRPKLATAFPLPSGGFPDLAKIFAFSPAGDVDFAAASPAVTDAQLRDVGEFGRPIGKFRDWMRSMLTWSNDTAASLSIGALGFPYINGVLAGAGFFDAAHQSGLWLSADYEGHDWMPNPPTNPQANRAGQPLSPRWQKAQGRKLSNITGTALQIARFLSRLAQDKLVADPASNSNQEMRDLMTGAFGIGSYVRSALAADHRSIASIASKIGFGDDARSHDCAIVERNLGSRKLRYVVVGLGSAPHNRTNLKKLFVRLDQIIVSLHP